MSTAKKKLSLANLQHIIPVIIGIIAFYLVAGPHMVFPENIGWIDRGDLLQQYLGFVFFRNSPWTLPIGLNPNYGLDASSSIVYSDSIPLMAIIGKLLSPILSQRFQYLGIWTLICFISQAWFAWLLAKRINSSFTNCVLITGLLVFSPPMFMQVGFHAYLTSHFLILAGIYLNFNKDIRLKSLYWLILLCSSVLINFYLFVMVFAMYFPQMIYDFSSPAGIKKRLFIIKNCITVMAIGMLCWQAGYFAVDSGSLSPTMYGESKMNILALFEACNWSFIVPNLSPEERVSQESFFYLGLGYLFLIPFALFAPQKNQDVINKLRTHKYLIFVFSCLTLFAISNAVRLGPWDFYINLPDQVLNIAGILRTCGRMFLPVFYAVLLLIIWRINQHKKQGLVTLLLATALSLQIIDTSKGWWPKRQLRESNYINDKPFNPHAILTNEFWSYAGGHYKNLISSAKQVPGFPPVNWEIWTSFAADFEMGTNAAYLARIDEEKLLLSEQAIEMQIITGSFAPNSLYIIENNLVISAMTSLNPKNDLLANINGFNVLAPGWYLCATCPKIPGDLVFSENLLSVKSDDLIDFSSKGNGRYYLTGEGWAYPENWGTWANGRNALLTIPLPQNYKKSKELIIKIQPFLSPKVTNQPISFRISGDEWQALTIKSTDQSDIHISLNRLQENMRFLTVEFQFHNPIRPKDVGIGDDQRQLSIGLISARFN